MKNILILGDSFTFGQGCADRLWHWDSAMNRFAGNPNLAYQGPSEMCWASLLAQDFTDYNVLNLSQPGIDNIKLATLGQNMIDSNTRLVIYNAPPSIRTQVRHPTSDLPVAWQLSNPEFDQDEKEVGADYAIAKKLYVTQLYHPDVLNNIAINAILSVYAAAITNGAVFILACMEYGEMIELSKTFKKVYLENKLVSLVSLVGSVYPEEYRSIDNHANELGHSYYYKNFVKPKVVGYL